MKEKVVYKSQSAGVSDWSYPPENEMSWHNPLTGIECHFNNDQFNFVFKDGKTSNAPMSSKADKIESISPKTSVVRAVKVHYQVANYVTGFELFDANKTCVLKIGDIRWNHASKEIMLEADDRIVGFKSRLNDHGKANHNNLVIVIARRTS